MKLSSSMGIIQIIDEILYSFILKKEQYSYETLRPFIYIQKQNIFMKFCNCIVVIYLLRTMKTQIV